MKSKFGINKLVLLVLLFAGAMTFMSCSENLVNDDQIVKEQSTQINAMSAVKSMTTSDMCGSASYTLWAGQNNNAGTVTVSNDDVNLYVTYTTTGGLLINEVHLFVSATPFTGRLAPGQAIYKAENVNAETYTFVLPLAEIGFECGSTIYLQAHAALSNGETAYGGTITKPKKGAWYGNISYTIVCCIEDPEEPGTGSETAFAYGFDYANCFLEYGFNRWGWTNGSLTEGEYLFDIYAGAGQCDLTKGTYVGKLYIEYFNGTATISYMMESGFVMSENHLYVGNEMFPSNNGESTVAPGQYPLVVEDLSATRTTYEITGLSGSVYVIAHAVVSTTDSGGGDIYE